MAEIVIAELKGYNPLSGLEETFYFSTAPFVTKPTDVPPNQWYEPRIEQPALIERSCFQSATTFGASQIGYGDMIINNLDGALDYLLPYSFAGRSIVIKLGEVFANSGGIPRYTTIITGVMAQAEFSWNKLTIKVRDRQQELAVPLQLTTFAGNNSLPNGVEGVATDLKGKRKPLLYGKVTGIDPPLVNTSRLIYQLNDGAINSVDAVYDRGVALSVGTARASLAALEGSAPAAGTYDYYLGGAYIRLGSTPTGTITVDATEGAATSNRTAAQVMYKILLEAGLTVFDVDSTDITALDTAAPYETGIYIGHDTDMTVIQAMDEIANSAGAFWGVDRVGVFRMKKIADPSSGTSIGTVRSVDTIGIERIGTRDHGGGIPSWQITLAYGKNYTPLSDLAASVAAADRPKFREEWRTVVDETASVLTTNAYSPSLRFNTLLTSASDAATEADARAALYGVRRDMYNIKIKVDSSLAEAIDLGKVITIELPRFDLTSGKKFLITSIRTDMRNNIFDLTVWG